MTTRYLLFDSECAICSGIAQEIEQISAGWLIARSLRDGEMQALLQTAQSNWKWEPTLIEIQDNETKILTGIQLRVHLILGVGLKRALHIVHIVSRHTPQLYRDTPRRAFVRRGAILAGSLLGLTMGQNVVFAAGCSGPACNCNPVTVGYYDCAPCASKCSCGCGCAVPLYSRTYYQCCPPYNPGQICGSTSFLIGTAICCG